MELVGFIMIMVGGCGLDSTGNAVFLAYGLCILGIALIVYGTYRGRRAKCHTKKRRRKSHGIYVIPKK